MLLKNIVELLDGVAPHSYYLNRPINQLQLDSRHINPGDLFLAVQGSVMDGRNFIQDAIERGAVAVLASFKSGDLKISVEIPVIYVYNLETQLGKIANYFYKQASERLKVVGFTGTNGKTSSSQFLAQICELNQLRCGIMGTLGNGFINSLTATNLTTQDVLSVHRNLADFINMKAKCVAMEVSSHALSQGRVDNVNFYIGVFTNLSQDHLDYHQNMLAYFQAKMKLFEELLPQYIVVNIDDQYGQMLAEHMYAKIPVVGITMLAENAHSNKYNIVYLDSETVVHTPWGSAKFIHPLLGQFNDYNVLTAMTCACLLEIPFKRVIASLNLLDAIPGRMQVVMPNHVPKVIVDFAHSPDALTRVLSELHNFKNNPNAKIWCVFGCGGDRDRTKRHPMLQAVMQYAQHIIITQDNSRTEDPLQIIDDILNNVTDLRITIELDRAKAIKFAISKADSSDIILVAGKGHECYQIIGEQKLEFSDYQVSKNELTKRLYINELS
jgi:UDP-N-acetylmuramoyl-L-alanyl-D-glutamate--2,6-diaminopimelate ligase